VTLILRIGFAIVIGVLVTSLMEWLLPQVPHGIDVLAGIIAAAVAYGTYPFGPNNRVV
jgi:hypothetical protein